MKRPTARPQVIAHRGFSGEYPENTIAAVEAAMAVGVDMVEVDVRLSRDGVPVLCHNTRVDKTSNGNGAVARMTLAELKRLDVGSWMHRDFSNESIPTLDELIVVARQRTLLNLDVKDEAAMPAVIEAVSLHGIEHSVVISGCTWRTVRQVRQVAPWLPVLVNVDRAVMALACLGLTRLAVTLLLWQSVLCNATGVNVAYNHVTPEAVARMAHANKPVWTWTVDTGMRALALARMGVASITSNHPDRILEALAI